MVYRDWRARRRPAPTEIRVSKVPMLPTAPAYRLPTPDPRMLRQDNAPCGALPTMPTAWRLPTLPTMRPIAYSAYQCCIAYIT